MRIIVEATDEELEAEAHQVFGPNSPSWSRTPAYNDIFLSAQQKYFNDKVFAKGHVFLNEVYDALGLPRTSLGAVLGWTKERIVDFGVDPSTILEANISLVFNPIDIIVDKI